MTASAGEVVRTVAASRGLRFPKLFALFALLLVVDLLIPDVVPFVDEILLGLATALLGLLRERRRAPRPEAQAVPAAPRQ